ncbi:hypothetical protein KYC_01220 [Achromobacter arsenitoxydans SY8]|uniref:Uncharacterized protein n=1 Tax=Achromobacter arsenitoxydans SY8 TaxID=477184 RepID=H0F0E1_9BURK|nr:hypothetical protein KYC_01220 [Achromobacter arsenitoxydans SY8]
MPPMSWVCTTYWAQAAPLDSKAASAQVAARGILMAGIPLLSGRPAYQREWRKGVRRTDDGG